MRTRTFWAQLLLIIVGLFFSASSYSACNLLSGLYLGAGIGDTFSNFDVHISSSTGGSFDKKLSDSRMQGNFFIGYGRVIVDSPFYLGGEVSVYTPSLNPSLERKGITLPNQTFTDTIKLTNYFNVDFTPGYLVCNRLLIYGRIGYGLNHLQFDQTNKNQIDERNFDSSNSALRVGAGIGYRVFPNLNAGIDYVYTQSQSSFNANPSNRPNVTVNYDTKPSTNFLGFRLSYLFL